MSIIIFSVKFWTVLWAVSHWLDNHLIDAINPGWFFSVEDAFTQNNFVVKMVINFVVAGMFVVIPLFWSGLLTWAVHRVGNNLTSLSKESGGTLSSAGSSGGKIATGGVKKGIK